MSCLKKVIKPILLIFIGFIFIILSYIAYLELNYYRIQNGQLLEIKNELKQKIDTNTSYSALTYNVGYGAYNQDFSFFMDYSYEKEGNKLVQGKYGKAMSKEHVLQNVENSISIMEKLDSDFILLQEVDQKAYRSFFVDMLDEISSKFKNHTYSFALNFHSKFLAYPLNDMHGNVDSGLLNLSKFKMTSSERISLPVSKKFIDKFFDLDRCFVVNKIPTNNNKNLILINVHLSAYDKGGLIRKKQLEILNNYIKKEYEKGEYIIVAGDFNHDYANSKSSFMGNKEIPSWIFELKNEDLSSGFSLVIPDNSHEVASCRSADEVFNEKTSYQCIIDGFFISDNIKAEAKIIDTKYIASDHNPVLLNFQLID